MDLHDGRWHIRLRRQSCEELLDLTLGLSRHSRGQLLDVLLREMRPEQHERREMQLAPLDPREQRRNRLTNRAALIRRKAAPSLIPSFR